MRTCILAILITPFLAITAFGEGEVKTKKDEVLIAKATYQPFFKEAGEGDQEIGPLWVDVDPVTNEQFQRFVLTHPKWKKSKIKKIFASKTYLQHWKNDEGFDASLASQPVTNVSWFAARAYCESRGRRLLTIAEWELVSDAQNPKVLEDVLKWYSKPNNAGREVGKGEPNKYGVRDMHGLIWEWVEDFNSVIIVGDSRSSNDKTSAQFCGAGSLNAKDPSEYATFMRFAFRNSLTAKSLTSGLGFRCGRDAK